MPSLDWNNALRQMCSTVVSKIPTVGFIGKILIGVFWGDNKQPIWDQIKEQVGDLVDSKIMQDDLNTVIGQLNGLHQLIYEYNETSGTDKWDKLNYLLNSLEILSAQLMGADYPAQLLGEAATNPVTPSVSDHPEQMIPIILAVAHIHLALLNDRQHNGAELLGEDLRSVWLTDFNRQYHIYVTFFNGILPKWKTWRFKQITATWDRKVTPIVGSLPVCYAEGCVRDTLTGEQCDFEIGGSQDTNACRAACELALRRMQNQAFATLINSISSVFHLNQYLLDADPNTLVELENASQMTLGPYSTAALGKESAPAIDVVSNPRDRGTITGFNVFNDGQVKGLQLVFADHRGDFYGYQGGEVSPVQLPVNQPVSGFKMIMGRDGLEYLEIVGALAMFGHTSGNGSVSIDATLCDRYALVGVDCDNSNRSINAIQLYFQYCNPAQTCMANQC